MAESIIARCEAKGLRMTDQRRIVARVIGAAEDHPDVEALYNRASAIDPRISIATVYRTVKLFEEAGNRSAHFDCHGLSHGKTVRRGRQSIRAFRLPRSIAR